MFQWFFYRAFCLIAQLVRPILLEVFGHFQICATGPPRPRTFLGRSALAPPAGEAPLTGAGSGPRRPSSKGLEVAEHISKEMRPR